MDQPIASAKGLRERLAGDRHRPRYHFLPPGNWMNDPNGPIQWQGRYHLFYQHNPHAPDWGAMHWGHAVSRDLVHWQDLPIALSPTPGSADEGGCWSGCAVDDGGVPTLIYTGVRGETWGEMQTSCHATGVDGLLTWQKHPSNPIIPSPPPGLLVVGFRDPCVWWEADAWYMVMGSGIKDVGGAALLYRSPDLVHWEYVHPLYARGAHEHDPLPTGYMWECPQFFPLGDRHVLIVSAMVEGQPNYVACFTGRYGGHRFEPESLQRLDYGADYYAPATLLDERGRRIIWGWSWEGRSQEAQRAAGWAGVMSLPRVLTLRPDGLLGVEPAPELETLRGRWCCLEGIALGVQGDAAEAATTSLLGGDCLEITAEFEAGDAAQLGLRVRCSPAGEEETLVYYDRAAGRLVVDRERASLDPSAHRGVHGGPFALAVGEPFVLRAFVDRSILEVYANGRACLTERIYPSRPDSLGVGLFARGGRARLRRLEAWEMGSIWEA